MQDPRTLTGLGNNVSQSGIGWMLQRLTQPGASAVPQQRPGETAVVGRSVTRSNRTPQSTIGKDAALITTRTRIAVGS